MSADAKAERDDGREPACADDPSADGYVQHSILVTHRPDAKAASPANDAGDSTPPTQAAISGAVGPSREDATAEVWEDQSRSTPQTRAHRPAGGSDNSQPTERTKARPSKRLARLIRGGRRVVVDLGIILIVTVTAATTVPPLLQKAILIEPINAPTSLEERGFTAEVLARRLRDELRQLYLEARHIGQTIGVTDVGADARVPEVEIPIANLSLRTIVTSIRGLLGLDDIRVAGEVTALLPAQPGGKPADEERPEPPPSYVMRLRLVGQGSFHVSSAGSAEIDPVLRAGALALLEEANPLLAARWYERRIRLDDLERVIRKMEARLEPALTTEAAIMRGNLLMRRRRTDEAVRQYDAVIAQFPTAIRARVFRSQALLRGGRFQAAVRAADEALAADAVGGALAHAFRADALNFLGRTAEAEAAANRAKELLPSNGQAHVTLCYIYLRRGEVEKALEAAQQAILRDRDLPTGYGALGNVLRQMGRAEEGLAEVRRGHEMDSTNPFLATSHGRHLRLLGRLEAAGEVAGRALKDDPENQNLLLLSAQIHNGLGEFAPALVTADRVIALRPRNLEAKLERARALVGLKRFEEARAVGEALAAEAVAEREIAANALAIVVTSLVLKGDVVEAERRLATARAQHPHHSGLDEAAGELASRRRDWAEAARLFRRVVTADPTRGPALTPRIATLERQVVRRR